MQYIKDNYKKDTGIDNDLQEMIWMSKDLKALAKWLTKHATAISVPIVGGTTAIKKEE